MQKTKTAQIRAVTYFHLEPMAGLNRRPADYVILSRDTRRHARDSARKML